MVDFVTLFGSPPEVKASAPGRVNLIGEHTDYNGGFVLPEAIPYYAVVELRKRSDHSVRVSSTRRKAGKIFEYKLGEEVSGRGWPDYVQGLTVVLRQEGYNISGFDALLDSNVPMGSGLSSSAALEISFLRAIRQAFTLRIDDLKLALLGQKAENNFVGARVGIMDQMASSLGEVGTALFIDTLTLEYQKLKLASNMFVVVIDSGISHKHKGGQYNLRRSECEKACQMLGVPYLRNLSVTDLGVIARLPSPLDRRARHVVTENARVIRAVEAIYNQDPVLLGKLFNESHASLRDDYEVSIPEIDELVQIAQQTEGVHGARLTGGGFGGSIVVLSEPKNSATIGKRIVEKYEEQTCRPASVLVPPAEGSEQHHE